MLRCGTLKRMKKLVVLTSSVGLSLLEPTNGHQLFDWTNLWFLIL